MKTSNKIKKEKIPRRSGFLGEFLVNFASATVLSYGIIYVLIPILGTSFYAPVKYFFVSSLLLSSLLFFKFFSLGKNQFVLNRVGAKSFFLCSLPMWGIYALCYVLYHASVILLPNAYFGNNLSGDGIYALALIFCGLRGRSVTAQALLYDPKHGFVSPDGMLPKEFILALAVSFVLNAIVHTLLAYVFYRSGINEREVEKKDIFNGTDKAYEKVQRWRFYSCFFPLVNYYPLYSWSYDYFVNPEPERKQKYFWCGALIIVVAMTAIEFLRYFFYLACDGELANEIVFYLSLHLVGVAIALVAYFDNRRHEKLMSFLERTK